LLAGSYLLWLLLWFGLGFALRLCFADSGPGLSLHSIRFSSLFWHHPLPFHFITSEHALILPPSFWPLTASLHCLLVLFRFRSRLIWIWS
jgi:hypothetical protein